MGNRFHEQTGDLVLANLKQHLAKTSQTIRGHVGRDDLPADYRRRVRDEAINDAKRASQEAWEAFGAWSQRKAQSARQTLAADEAGTQADEIRKLRQEQTIQRLIQTARLSDDRTGSQVLVSGGRLVRNPAAHRLAAEAQRLYLETSDYRGALAHAEAALALGVESARGTRDRAQAQLWAEDPAKRQALRDLETVERAQSIFVRDNGAALADALNAAAEEARDQGDDPSTFLKAAVGPSMQSKAAAIAAAAAAGEEYAHPAGALASAPRSTEQ